MQGGGGGGVSCLPTVETNEGYGKKNSPVFARDESMVTNDTHREKTCYKQGEGGGLGGRGCEGPSAFEVVVWSRQGPRHLEPRHEE